MADLETGVQIPVGASAVAGSGKKAVDDIAKEIKIELKEGYIEIPAEIKIPMDGSKDLKKAQKDVISQWRKTFKEGFSSSAQDLDMLEKAYNKFKKLGKDEGKLRTPQSKGITAMMGGQISEYKRIKSSVVSDPTEKHTKKKTQQYNEEEAIQDAINKEEERQLKHAKSKTKTMDKFAKNLEKGASRAKAATPGADVNLGTRASTWDGSQVTKRSIRLSEGSPYSSNWAVQQEKAMKDAQAEVKKSLKTYTATGPKLQTILDNVRGTNVEQTRGNQQAYEKSLVENMKQIQKSLLTGERS